MTRIGGLFLCLGAVIIQRVKVYVPRYFTLAHGFVLALVGTCLYTSSHLTCLR